MKNLQRISHLLLASLLLMTAGVPLLGAPLAYAFPNTSSLLVPVDGTVDGTFEPVFLTGRIHVVTHQLLPSDPVRLDFNLVDVHGVGLSTGARYVANGAAQITLPAAPVDPIRLLFPFVPVDPAFPGGRTLVNFLQATVALTFSVDTGLLTGATAFFSTPLTE